MTIPAITQHAPLIPQSRPNLIWQSDGSCHSMSSSPAGYNYTPSREDAILAVQEFKGLFKNETARGVPLRSRPKLRSLTVILNEEKSW